MIVVCAYCGDHLRKIEDGTSRISHGICPVCLEQEREKYGLAVPAGDQGVAHPHLTLEAQGGRCYYIEGGER